EAEVGLARESYDAAARALSNKRHHSGTALAGAVMAELPALKLERARFMVDISTDAGTEYLREAALSAKSRSSTRSSSR
ncbi:DNA repair protein RecN, partial [Rhizobium ruizarguesonis]